MESLFYTNEFLKKLEPIIVKGDMKNIQKIKETLVLIAQDSNKNKKKIKLENIKTKTNNEIYINEVELSKSIYNLFWTVKGDKKIIISLTKDT